MIFETPNRVLKKILKRTNGAITVASLMSEKRKIRVRVIADGIVRKAVLINTKSKYLVAFVLDENGNYMLNDKKDEVMTETINFDKLELIATWG